MFIAFVIFASDPFSRALTIVIAAAGIALLAWGIVSRAEPEPPRENATATNLRELLQAKCPSCGSTLDGHTYAQLASLVFNGPKRQPYEPFLRAADERDWAALAAFNEFDPTADDLEAFSIECGQSAVSIVVRKSVAQLYDADSLLRAAALDDQESAKLKAQFANTVRNAFAPAAESGAT